MLTGLRQDASDAIRGLRRTPLVCTAIVLSMGLGVGVNGALVALVDRALFRPPEGVVRHEEVRRVFVRRRIRLDPAPTVMEQFTARDLGGLRRALAGRGMLEGFDTWENRRMGDDRQPVAFSYVSPGFFALAGVRAVVGSLPTLDSTASDERRLVLLSHALWQSTFGGDRNIVGRSITVDSATYTVTGVAQPGFAGFDLGTVDMWSPLTTAPYGPEGQTGDVNILTLILRLDPSSTDLATEDRLSVAYRALHESDSWPDSTARILAAPVLQARGPLRLGEKNESNLALMTRLGWVSSAVLVLAVCNFGSLILVRALRRRGEFAIRVALGVSRRRLVTSALMEAALLGAVSAVAAVLIAGWTGGVLRATLFPAIHWPGPVMSARLLLFIGATALATSLVAGLAPVGLLTSENLLMALKSGPQSSNVDRSKVRRGLLITQVALCMSLLTAAGVFVQSLRRAVSVDLGFDATRLVTLVLPGLQRDAQALASVRHAVQTMPQVESVGSSEDDIVLGGTWLTMVLANGDTVRQRQAPPFLAVDPGFFAAAGLRVVRGRPLSASDVRGSANAAVITESMARAYMRPDPIGESFCMLPRMCWTIVGVVRDLRSQIAAPQRPLFLVPWAQWSQSPLAEANPIYLHVRTREPASAAVAAAIQQTAQRVAPTRVDGPRARWMTERLAPQLVPIRVATTLFAGFGLLALLSAALGIYGLVSYNVTQRSRELGVRLALGARLSDILHLIVASEMRWVGVGIAVGSGISVLEWRAFTALLFETSPRDAATLPVAAVVLVVAALVASLAPAVRTARLPLAATLRSE